MANDGINTYYAPLQSLTVVSGSAGTQALPTNNVSANFPWNSASSAYSLSDTAVLNFSQASEQENFNGTTVTTLTANAIVPEPASMLLLLAAPVLLLMRRGRRASSIA